MARRGGVASASRARKIRDFNGANADPEGSGDFRNRHFANDVEQARAPIAACDVAQAGAHLLKAEARSTRTSAMGGHPAIARRSATCCCAAQLSRNRLRVMVRSTRERSPDECDREPSTRGRTCQPSGPRRAPRPRSGTARSGRHPGSATVRRLAEAVHAVYLRYRGLRKFPPSRGARDSVDPCRKRYSCRRTGSGAAGACRRWSARRRRARRWRPDHRPRLQPAHHATDPTAHAEVLGRARAARVLRNYRLTDATVYVTVEPCLMCVGAMVHARVREVSTARGAEDRRARVDGEGAHAGPESSLRGHPRCARGRLPLDHPGVLPRQAPGPDSGGSREGIIGLSS